LLVSAFKDKTIFCCQGFCTSGVQSFAFVFRLRDGESRSALAGRIDFGEIELRDKRPDASPLLEDCSFQLLRTKLFSAAKDFVLQVYSLLPSCFASEMAKAVPPYQGGGPKAT